MTRAAPRTIVVWPDLVGCAFVNAGGAAMRRDDARGVVVVVVVEVQLFTRVEPRVQLFTRLEPRMRRSHVTATGRESGWQSSWQMPPGESRAGL